MRKKYEMTFVMAELDTQEYDSSGSCTLKTVDRFSKHKERLEALSRDGWEIKAAAPIQGGNNTLFALQREIEL